MVPESDSPLFSVDFFGGLNMHQQRWKINVFGRGFLSFEVFILFLV